MKMVRVLADLTSPLKLDAGVHLRRTSLLKEIYGATYTILALLNCIRNQVIINN